MQDSNLRPLACRASALTNWANRPGILELLFYTAQRQGSEVLKQQPGAYATSFSDDVPLNRSTYVPGYCPCLKCHIIGVGQYNILRSRNKLTFTNTWKSCMILSWKAVQSPNDYRTIVNVTLLSFQSSFFVFCTNFWTLTNDVKKNTIFIQTAWTLWRLQFSDSHCFL